ININDTTLPTATLTPIAAISDTGGEEQTFTVTYSDDVAISISSLGSSDILVSGPRNFSQLATLLSIDANTSGSPRIATYQFTTPGGTWNAIDDGIYTLTLQASQVRDLSGN